MNDGAIKVSTIKVAECKQFHQVPLKPLVKMKKKLLEMFLKKEPTVFLHFIKLKFNEEIQILQKL